eukprot:COSAG04_NODE_131_length_24280_cov_40.563418_1_plen_156_part_00
MQRVTSFPCLPQDSCVAGRGDHYIEHGGYTWRTLDGADPQGGFLGAPNGGCQCEDQNGDGTVNSLDCPSNYLPLPAGWVLAPNDATSIAVVAAHGWSTQCPVLADGTAWVSANHWSGVSPGDACWDYSSGQLATSGGTYTVRHCYRRMRVLARCG